MKKLIALFVFAGFLAVLSLACDNKPATKPTGTGTGTKAPEKKM